MKSRLPIFTGLMYSVILGFTTPVSKLALDYFEPLQLNALRFLFATLAMSAMALFGVIRITMNGSQLLKVLGLSLLMPITYYACDIFSLSLIDASLSALIQGAMPAAVALISYIVLREKTTRRQALFIALSFAGVVIVFASKKLGGSTALGILLAACAVLANALYTVLLKKTLSDKVTAGEVTLITAASGTVFFFVISCLKYDITPLEHFEPLFSVERLLIVCYLGIVSNGLGFFLMNYTLSRVRPVQTAVFSNLIIVTSVLAGVLMLGESFSWNYIVGFPVIAAGVFGTVLAKTPERAGGELPDGRLD